MIQVIYIRYMKVYVKEFSGETEHEDARSFIDYLENHLFDGGVVVGVFASEWVKTRVGERAERDLVGRFWMYEDSRAVPDRRLREMLENNFESPCQHCDGWCRGQCHGSTKCIQAGKPGHVNCSSRLIDDGVLTRRQ